MGMMEQERVITERVQRKYPKLWKYYLELLSFEIKSADEIHEYNLKKSIEIMRWAYKKTVFYKRFYDDHGINPEDINNDEDWERLPVVTKEMIREYGHEMVVPGPEALRMSVMTGGSTGIPLKLWKDRRTFDLPPVEWRPRGWWCGRKPATISCNKPIIGGNLAFCERCSGPDHQTKEEWNTFCNEWRPMRFVRLDVQNMTSDNIVRFLHDAEEIGVAHLYGYAGAVDELCDYIIANGLQRRIVPLTVSTAACPLTSGLREKINIAFGTEAFDIYGANDIGRMAAECINHDETLHLFADRVKMDIVDDNESAIHDEREGCTVVTPFTERTMPLIRYKIGDITHWVKGKCSCGISLPRIAGIRGRESMHIEDAKGVRLHSPQCFFAYDNECAKAFQFVQNAPGDVVVRVVPNTHCNDAICRIRTIISQVQAHFNGTVRLSLVDKIPHDGGKIRFIIHQEKSNANL